jgi:hypothetical protein
MAAIPTGDNALRVTESMLCAPAGPTTRGERSA